MKLPATCNYCPDPRSGFRAFTLVEIQVSMAVIMLVIGGVISSHVFGLKLNEGTRAKLSASDAARSAIGNLVGDVRSARIVQVGNGTYAAFTPVAAGSVQRGSALRIYPSTSSSIIGIRPIHR
jgi:Tfp pilus assembly protein PilW